jgi:hypothetical protein
MANEQVLFCPKCRVALPEALFNRGAFSPCPNCGTEVRCEVFPALYAGPRIGRPGELLVDASEASCFFHPEKKAAVACESCGRFLCALCDLDFSGRHICPNCLAASRKKGALGNLDHFRFSWTGLALLLSTVPLVAYPFTFFTFITAPTAIVVALIGLRKPPSLTGRRRVISMTVALAFSFAEIGWWIWLGRTLMRYKPGG